MKKYEDKVEQLINTGSMLLDKVSNFEIRMTDREIERTKASAGIMKQMINALDVHIRLEKLSAEVRYTTPDKK